VKALFDKMSRKAGKETSSRSSGAAPHAVTARSEQPRKKVKACPLLDSELAHDVDVGGAVVATKRLGRLGGRGTKRLADIDVAELRRNVLAGSKDFFTSQGEALAAPSDASSSIAGSKNRFASQGEAVAALSDARSSTPQSTPRLARRCGGKQQPPVT
jgi:hypothetical protein